MPAESKPSLLRPRTGRFRLMRYFTVASLVAFAIVGLALYHLERQEKDFFEAVQREQGEFFARAQEELVREQKSAARNTLLLQHEAGHVSLASLFANALWSQHFAPLVERAQRISFEHCRGLGGGPKDASPATLKARQACYAEAGKAIRSLPGFAAVDAAVHAMMKSSAVFKIKVYDLRGLTVYSSELAQIGEDKADNLGWLSASQGRAASELVHRDRFSAFEGEVFNRDLIQSYVPVQAPGADGIRGVFEIYSDVTPLLGHIEEYSARIADVAAANQSKVEAAGLENRRKVSAASASHFAILGGLLALLYAVLLVLVRVGQAIIDEQVTAREQAALREQSWHHEKMAALATMAANASHEIGNPLAVISGLAEDLDRAKAAGEPIGDQPRAIQEQASRIAGMTRRITEFAGARSETSEPVDANQMIKAVCDFLGFDSRYRATRLEMRLAERLPACVAIPDHLNEVLMTLLQAHAEACLHTAEAGRIVVESESRDAEVTIRIGCDCGGADGGCALAATDARLDSARRRMEGMGGRLVPAGSTTEIVLRCL